VIDDAKVPDRPFKVKCPKCQAVVSLPGKGSPASTLPPVPPAPAPEPVVPPAAPPAEEPRPPMAAVHREASAGSAGRALVALTDSSQAGALTLTLTRLGYTVDTLSDPEEAIRLLEQGIFALVATSRTAAATRNETLYQRINRLSPDARRRIFLLLVGDEFKTGDGTQAWVVVADLVVHSRDAGNLDALLHSTLAERSRLYQAFHDARARFEAASAS
jgi:hypothetical protein